MRFCGLEASSWRCPCLVADALGVDAAHESARFVFDFSGFFVEFPEAPEFKVLGVLVQLLVLRVVYGVCEVACCLSWSSYCVEVLEAFGGVVLECDDVQHGFPLDFAFQEFQFGLRDFFLNSESFVCLL